MNNSIEVNISILEQDASAVRGRIDGLKRDIKKLEIIMDELNAMWEGESKKIYLWKLAKDKDNVEELLNEADRITKKMSDAVKIYKDCEITVGQEIDELRV